MLPSKIVNRLKVNLNKWLQETATIQKPTEVRGVFGERIEGYQTVATNVPCRIIDTTSMGSNSKELVSNQEILIDRYTVVLPSETLIDVDYLVIVGDKTYRIININDNRTNKLDVQATAERER